MSLSYLFHKIQCMTIHEGNHGDHVLKMAASRDEGQQPQLPWTVM